MKYIGTHRFWMKDAGMTYILPYIHITVERIQHFYSLGIEAGWLNKWCSIQWSFTKSSKKNNYDLMKVMAAFSLTWFLVACTISIWPVILLFPLWQWRQSLPDAKPVMWIDAGFKRPFSTPPPKPKGGQS